jgi:hypothetical protein
MAVLAGALATGCAITSVTVTEVAETGPRIVIDATNASTSLAEIRYEFAESGGTSEGAVSAMGCQRATTELGRARGPLELFVDGRSIGIHELTVEEAAADWLVMAIEIDASQAATLEDVRAAGADPLASPQELPGCGD